MRAICRAVAGSSAAVPAWAAPDRLPAEPPIGGVLWSWIVPLLLFAVAAGATFLLYRHFAGRQDREPGPKPRTGTGEARSG